MKAHVTRKKCLALAKYRSKNETQVISNAFSFFFDEISYHLSIITSSSIRSLIMSTDMILKVAKWYVILSCGNMLLGSMYSVINSNMRTILWGFDPDTEKPFTPLRIATTILKMVIMAPYTTAQFLWYYCQRKMMSKEELEYQQKVQWEAIDKLIKDSKIFPEKSRNC